MSAAAVGTTVVTATLGSIFGSTHLTVDAAALVSIEVIPAFNVFPPSTGRIAIGAEVRFVAAGYYTDSSIQDVTDLALWSSSDSGVAVVENTPGTRGLASGVAAGVAAIEAAIASVKGTASLTVLPVTALDIGIPNVKAAGLGGVGMSGSGRALAVWNYQFTGGGFGTPPLLYTASYAPGSGWAKKEPIDFGSIDDFPAAPALAVSVGGSALLAWTGHGGVYAAEYTPASGWQQARTIASGATPFLTFAEGLRLSIDFEGNGLLVWANDNGDVLLASQYQQTSGTWSTPQEIPGATRGFARGAFSLAMNAGGSAVLLWENWTPGSTPAWTLSASLFAAGTGPVSGWQAPQPLYRSESFHTPEAAINDSGEILAVWVDYVTDFPSTSLYARQWAPNPGWQALQEISVRDAGRPADPELAVNDAGQAVVVWRNAFDKAVRASRFVAGEGWQALETLWPTGIGDPTVLRPHLAPNGRMLAAWVVEDLSAPFKVGFRRHVPGIGWEAAQGLPHIGHKGDFSGVRLAFDEEGSGVALWAEIFEIVDGEFSNSNSDFFANAELAY